MICKSCKHVAYRPIETDLVNVVVMACSKKRVRFVSNKADLVSVKQNHPDFKWQLIPQECREYERA